MGNGSTLGAFRVCSRPHNLKSCLQGVFLFWDPEARAGNHWTQQWRRASAASEGTEREPDAGMASGEEKQEITKPVQTQWSLLDKVLGVVEKQPKGGMWRWSLTYMFTYIPPNFHNYITYTIHSLTDTSWLLTYSVLEPLVLVAFVQ